MNGCSINILWRYLSPSKNFISPRKLQIIFDFFAHLGWFTQKNGNYQFTETDCFLQKSCGLWCDGPICQHFSKMDDLLLQCCCFKDAEGEDEAHVDREMNVWEAVALMKPISK
jgi:hypothetical protein